MSWMRPLGGFLPILYLKKREAYLDITPQRVYSRPDELPASLPADVSDIHNYNFQEARIGYE